MLTWLRLHRGDLSRRTVIGAIALVMLACFGPLAALLALGRVAVSMEMLLTTALPAAGGILAVLIILALRARLGLLQSAIDAAQSAIVVYDKDDRLLLSNKRYRLILGIPPSLFRPGAAYRDLVGRSLEQTMSEADAERELDRRAAIQTVADGVPNDRRYPGGRWERVTKTRMRHGATIGVAMDVTEYYKLKEQLETEVRRFRALADNAPVGICLADLGGRIAFVNGPLLAMLEEDDARALMGRRRSFLFADETYSSFSDLLHGLRVSEGESEVRFEQDGQQRDVLVRKAFVNTTDIFGQVMPQRESTGENIYIFIDITDRNKAKARIEYLAAHDALTGVLNRAAFQDDLEAAALAANEGAPVTLIAIDLDRFKPVNDQYGHRVGDLLLKAVVARIEAMLNTDMRLYRVGGDEFTILCRSGDRPHLVAFAERLSNALCAPFSVEGRDVVVGASLGVSALPTDTHDSETLIHYADLALYQVKNGGGSGVRAFTESYLTQVDPRALLESDLVDAVEREEIQLAFQPVVCTREGKIVGAEALARWLNRRTGEMVTPGRFIPLAEDRRFVEKIDRLVFCAALRQFSEWKAEGLSPQMMMVNMSPVTLVDPSMVAFVGEAISAHNIPPSAMVIELSGTALSTAGALRNRSIEEIHKLGVRFALDDFGLAATSLSDLAELPIGFLKIDQSLIANIAVDDARGRNVTRTILKLAQSLDMEAIAEGVERDEQFQVLEGMGCSLMQGNRFAVPSDPAAFVAMLKDGTVNGLVSQRG
ncbi:MAG: EAL domain-containing protein [Devosia sp.]